MGPALSCHRYQPVTDLFPFALDIEISEKDETLMNDWFAAKSYG